MRGLGQSADDFVVTHAPGFTPVSTNYPTLPADDDIIDAGTVTAEFDWQFWALIALGAFVTWKFLGPTPARRRRRH